jgi:hypothetical protein
MNGGLYFGMPGSFGRHGEDFALEQLIPPRLANGPGEVLVNGHALLGQGGHRDDTIA